MTARLSNEPLLWEYRGLGTWPGRRAGCRRLTGGGDIRAETGRMSVGRRGDRRVQRCGLAFRADDLEGVKSREYIKDKEIKSKLSLQLFYDLFIF